MRVWVRRPGMGPDVGGFQDPMTRREAFHVLGLKYAHTAALRCVNAVCPGRGLTAIRYGHSTRS